MAQGLKRKGLNDLKIWTIYSREHIGSTIKVKKIGATIHETLINSMQPYGIQLYTIIGFIVGVMEPGRHNIPRMYWHVTKVNRDRTSIHNNKGIYVVQ